MDYFGEIISFILGAIGGSLITYQVTKKSVRASEQSTAVDQSGATSGGDMVGRDQNKS